MKLRIRHLFILIYLCIIVTIQHDEPLASGQSIPLFFIDEFAHPVFYYVEGKRIETAPYSAALLCGFDGASWRPWEQFGVFQNGEKVDCYDNEGYVNSGLFPNGKINVTFYDRDYNAYAGVTTLSQGVYADEGNINYGTGITWRGTSPWKIDAFIGIPSLINAVPRRGRLAWDGSLYIDIDNDGDMDHLYFVPDEEVEGYYQLWMDWRGQSIRTRYYCFDHSSFDWRGDDLSAFQYIQFLDADGDGILEMFVVSNDGYSISPHLEFYSFHDGLFTEEYCFHNAD